MGTKCRAYLSHLSVQCLNCDCNEDLTVYLHSATLYRPISMPG